LTHKSRASACGCHRKIPSLSAGGNLEIIWAGAFFMRDVDCRKKLLESPQRFSLSQSSALGGRQCEIDR
jgi:hypothetical protein